MKKLISIVLIIAIVFALAACGSGRGEQAQITMPQETGTYTATAAEQYIEPTVEETGAIYGRNSLILPDENVIIYQAVKSGESIYLYGMGAANTQMLYKTDLACTAFEKIALPEDLRIYSISADLNGGINMLGMNEDGEFILSALVDGALSDGAALPMLDEYLNNTITQIFEVENGFIVFTATEILALNADGKLNKGLGAYYRLGTCLPREDGTIMLISQERSDPAAKSPTTKTQILSEDFSILESYESNSQFTSFYADYNTDGNTVLAHNVSTLYRFDYENDTKEALINTSASSMTVGNIICLGEEQYFAADYQGPALWEPYNGQAPSQLTLAAYNLDFILSKLIKAYNESGAEYRVNVIDYAMYDEAGKEGQGLVRLRSDIIAGRAPDIYDLSQLPAQLYADKGLFVDMKPYFAGDAPIQYSDFVQSAVKALEYDGGLYYIAPGFNVLTVCGSPNFVGSDNTWTPEEFFAAVEGMNPVDVFGPETTRDTFLAYLIFFLGNEYIDIEKMECHFDAESFQQFLTFAAKLPVECDYSTLDSQPTARAFMGVQPILFCFIGSRALSRMATNNTIFGGKAQYVGFPSNSSGTALAPEALMSMSVSSQNKEGVMDFIYFALDESSLRSDMYCPIIQSQLTKRMGFWEDAYLNENTTLNTFYDGATLLIEAEADIDAVKECFVEIIERMDSTTLYDDGILQIIFRESQAFFAGDISVQQAAASIQSKVQIYLAEQYG